MTKALTLTYSAAQEYRTQIMYALVVTSVMLIGMYAFNVYRLISNTVALQQINSQTASLSSSVDQLDSAYLAASSVITPDHVAKYGMTQGSVTAYIPKSQSVSQVAMSGHDL